MIIVEGSYGKVLSKALSDRYKLELIKVKTDKFANRDSRVILEGDVEGQECMLVQSMARRTNHALVELLLIADALVENGASRVRAIVPFLGYSFQNRHFDNEPVSCRVVAKMISNSQVSEITVMDLHESSSIEFFDIPSKNIETSKIFGEWLRGSGLTDFCIVTPDKGSKDRALSLASMVGCDIVVLDKKRDIGTLKVVSNEVVEGRVLENCVVVDDAINTGGTLESVCNVLRENGAKHIVWISTHFLGIEGSYERVMSNIDTLVTTNTVDHGLVESEKVKILDASELVKI